MTADLLELGVPTSTPPRRRWPRVVAVLVGVVLVGGVIAWRTYAANATVLVSGSTGYYPRCEAARYDTIAGDTDFRLVYEDQQECSFGFSVRNVSRVPVTVTDPMIREGGYHLFELVSARRGRDGADTSVVPGAMEAFTPFVVAPGEERYVDFTGRFGDCEHSVPGGANSMTSKRLGIRVLGVTRTVDVDVDFALSVESPDDCPRR